jgi:hypothetical protein
MKPQSEVCIDCLSGISVEQQLCADCLLQIPYLENLTKQLLPEEFALLNLYKSAATQPWTFHFAGPDGWTDRERYTRIATAFAKDKMLRQKLERVGLKYIGPAGFADAYIFDINDCITFVQWVESEGLQLLTAASNSDV